MTQRTTSLLALRPVAVGSCKRMWWASPCACRCATDWHVSAAPEASSVLKRGFHARRSRSLERAPSTFARETKGRKAPLGSARSAVQPCTTRWRATLKRLQYLWVRLRTLRFPHQASRCMRSACIPGCTCQATSSAWHEAQSATEPLHRSDGTKTSPLCRRSCRPSAARR